MTTRRHAEHLGLALAAGTGLGAMLLVAREFGLDGLGRAAVAALAAGVLARCPLRLSSRASRWSPAEPLVLGAAVIAGLPAAAMIAAAEALSRALARDPHGRRGTAALAHLFIAMAGAGVVTALLPAAASPDLAPATLVPAVSLGAMTRFVLLLGARRSIQRAESRRRQRWNGHAAWNGALHLGSAAITLLLLVGYQQFGLLTLALEIAVGTLLAALVRSWTERVRSLHDHLVEVQNLHGRVIDAFSIAIDARDPRASGRARRVRLYARQLGELVRREAPDLLPSDRVPDDAWLEGLSATAVLQDVGLLCLPDHIVHRAETLGGVERERLEEHAELGARIISRLGFPPELAAVVRHHHERWDGRGYPDGLAREAIPIEARILALATGLDEARRSFAVDSITPKQLVAWVATRAGTEFDPRLAELYCRNASEIEAVVEEHECKTTGTFEGENTDVLTEDLHRARHQSLVLHELSARLGASLEVGDLILLVGNRLLGLMPAHTVALYVGEPTGDTLQPLGCAGPVQELLGRRTFGVGEGVTGWVFEHGRAVLNADARIDLGRAIEQADPPLRSAAVFPVEDPLGRIGVIAFYAAEDQPFTDEHRRIVEQIAPQLAAAMRNALLYQATRENSMTDALTGLPNNRALHQQLERELARARRTCEPLSVVVLDLDRFKPINDTWGHQAGDRVLREIARRLQSGFRNCDHVSRYAGDEFVAILPGTDREAALAVVRRVQEMLDGHPIALADGTEVGVGISAGLACFPVDGRTPEDLLRVADRKMYEDKAARRSRVPAPPPKRSPEHRTVAP